VNTSDVQWNIKVRDTAQQFSAAKGRAEAAMARAVQFAAQRGVLSAELARVRAEIARRGGTPAGGSGFSARMKRPAAQQPVPTKFTGEPSLQDALTMVATVGRKNLFCFNGGGGPVHVTD
jgi:hypothetical protein